MVNITTYREMLQQPWGKIQYDITFSQLAHLKNKRILDFGAGFGLVSQFLADLGNEVTAVEPNTEMLDLETQTNYQKILGSIEQLTDFPDESFDLILCHNVLEYVKPNQLPAYLAEFKRLLNTDGKLSIIKHNQAGKILQSVVFSNDVDTALHLLNGGEFHSQSFAQGSTYSIENLIEMSGLTLENYQAIRTFYSLQPNDFKTEEGWLEKMTEMELAVCNLKPYKDISFLQHVWLKK
ncbi:class I SAM-dependent methyltransferase [Streptococcus ovis]|uniref:class I SAM-dependent methyltransferase n=1 Tax=Streptococcus ovis TaxID=82806 RepID=UPI000380E5FC|nr:class I SAM-dependent methyltransferase [Streptococcus ovis]